MELRKHHAHQKKILMRLLISSFDATIRVKRAFHPAPASRGFASHVFLVKYYFANFSPRDTKLRISQDICCLRTTNIQCIIRTIFGQCNNVLNNNIIFVCFKTESRLVLATLTWLNILIILQTSLKQFRVQTLFHLLTSLTFSNVN